jgi:hypothetical protein
MASSSPAERLTPRQRVDAFFARIGLGHLSVEHEIEAVYGLRDQRTDTEDSIRMGQIAFGGRRSVDGPMICTEYLSEEQLAELEEIWPTLTRIHAQVERRLRRRRMPFFDRTAIGPRGRGLCATMHHPIARQRGRECRPSFNGRRRGSRRSSPRAGPSDESDLEPPHRRAAS